MEKLYLEDLSGLSEEEVKQHIVSSYEVEPSIIDKYEVLVAYESVGNWGCDSSSWILLKEKSTGDLFETHGNHCSCYGFEGQFEPEETSIEYLQSDNFYFSCGGYDDNESENVSKVKEYLSKLWGDLNEKLW